jgi:hypothetical protein
MYKASVRHLSNIETSPLGPTIQFALQYAALANRPRKRRGQGYQQRKAALRLVAAKQVAGVDLVSDIIEHIGHPITHDYICLLLEGI